MLSDGVIMRHTGVDEPEKLEAGTTIWCTGIKINPVAAQLAEALPAGTQARLPAARCSTVSHINAPNSLEENFGALHALLRQCRLPSAHACSSARVLSAPP